MDKIKLCMMAPEFFPVWGGTGSYIIELIKHLPENVEVHVVTLRRSISNLCDNGLQGKSIDSVIHRPLKIHYIADAKETFFYNLAFQLACLKAIPKLNNEYQFDILHSHLSHMPDVFLALLGKSHVPTVATVHSTIQMQKDITLLASSGFGDLEWSEINTLLFYPVINFLQKNYVKRVSGFIAVSDITRKVLMKHLNVDAEKIDLIYNGVDIELFHPAKGMELERKYSNPTVVYIGRMMAKKGIHILIKAMPQILRLFPEARFLFVGGGNVFLYQEMIKKAGVAENNVSFVGHLGYFERLKILREATVFVNPSFFENCSISILEAMSSGAAVVASDTGGNPELIQSGKNGLLVPIASDKKLAESIVSLLEDEKFNRKIGEEARMTVERAFSAKKSAYKTYKTYGKILRT